MAGNFTGHYMGEVLDTYQWPGEFHRTLRRKVLYTYLGSVISPVTTWERF